MISVQVFLSFRNHVSDWLPLHPLLVITQRHSCLFCNNLISTQNVTFNLHYQLVKAGGKTCKLFLNNFHRCCYRIYTYVCSAWMDIFCFSETEDPWGSSCGTPKVSWDLVQPSLHSGGLLWLLCKQRLLRGLGGGGITNIIPSLKNNSLCI